jgi:hypothetical protein
MLNSLQQTTGRVGDTVFAASRQMWLAGLGAAAVTRDWAEKEAGDVLRTLVREGSAVESRAIRFVGERVDSSVTRANVLLRRTRATVESAVRIYADTAVSLVRQTLPKSLPKVGLPVMRKPSSPVKSSATRGRKAVKPRTGVAAKRAKGRVKSTKR